MSRLGAGRIWTGPLASGKSTRLRGAFLRAAAPLMLVPTATMARHVRHELARAGHVVRPVQVRTLAEFTAALCGDDPAPVSPGALVMLVRQVLAGDPQPWGASARTPGFQESAANTIAELDARGYTSADALATAQLVEDPPPEPMAFLRLFAQVEEKVRAAGLALRSWRLREATSRAFALGQGASLVLVDGFFSFTEPEIGLLNALRRHAEVLITLPDWPGAGASRQRLLQFGFEEDSAAGGALRECTFALVTAGGFDAEVRGIAQRIVKLRGQGVAYREMGVILREEKPYAPALRSVLSSLKIPARFYFVESLDAQPLFRYFVQLADATREGWEHETALAALRSTYSGLGGTPDGDDLDFQIRSRLPCAGLEPLLMLHPKLAGLGRFDAWWRSEGTGAELGAGLRTLITEAAAAKTLDPLEDGAIAIARNRHTTLRAAIEALDETRRLVPGPIRASAFWDEFATVARFTPVREPDERRDAVHVLDVYEARQWRLRHVFCPGLLEGRFPQHASDDPLLPDRFRQRLCELGLPVRTLGERQQEEDFLFDLARTRASDTFAASYPRFDRQGGATLPSFFLEGVSVTRETNGIRLQPPPSHAVSRSIPRPHLEQASAVAAIHRSWSPARLESFLQCPYQFFGRHTIKLEGVPPRPEDRLDRMAQGQLVHEVLAFWQKDASQPIESIFERLFVRLCRDRNARPGYLLEMARLEMLRHVREFAKRFHVRAGWRAEYEAKVHFALASGVDVRARIDRVDVSPSGEAAVFDFKYSGGEAIRRRVRDHGEFPLVQGGLYLMGLEQTRGLRPHSFHYVALRDEAKEHGWEEPGEVRRIMQTARDLTLDAVERIRAGEIKANPRDTHLCSFCDFRDACRVSGKAAEVALPAGG